jgi:hypothetical protein
VQDHVAIPLTGSKTKFVAVATLCVVLGGLAVIGGIFGKGSGMVVPLVVGTPFLLIGGWLFVAMPKITRPRMLVIGRQGIQCVDPRGQSWALGWRELGGCVITTAYHQGVGQVYNPKTWRVRLEWQPADPGFPLRHPELAPFAGRFSNWANGYGFPLGPRIDLVGPMDFALRQFGAPVYGGVIELGRQMGFGYV